MPLLQQVLLPINQHAPHFVAQCAHRRCTGLTTQRESGTKSTATGEGLRQVYAAMHSSASRPVTGLMKQLPSPKVSMSQFFVTVMVACVYWAFSAVKGQAWRSLRQLQDITASTGIRFEHLSSPEQRYIVESMSGGVALFDYDGDGWLTLSQTPSVSMVLTQGEGALYHNDHDGTFTDVTDKAGVGNPCWAMGGRSIDQRRPPDL